MQHRFNISFETLNTGSCWAFSAVAAVEGINKLKTGRLISLSEQEVVDCDRTDETIGCQGGWMDDAFHFIQKTGLSTEKSYPYQGTQNNCTSKRFHRKTTITGYEDVPANNETNLLKAVAHQPVSVAIDAQSFEFRFFFFSDRKCLELFAYARANT